MWHFLNIFHRGVVQTHNRKTLKSLKITDLASAPMNKKHSKNNSKDQRHSKDTKWIRLQGYYCRYERERRGESKRIQIRTKALLTLLNDIYEPRSATEKRMISYLACLVDKEFRGHSYRSHVSYIESHQGLLHMYGLKRVPSKPCLHHAAIVLAGCAKIQGVVGMLAGGRGARIPAGGFQRVLHNAVRGLGRRQEGDHIQTRVRQAARAGRRARQEESYPARLPRERPTTRPGSGGSSRGCLAARGA